MLSKRKRLHRWAIYTFCMDWLWGRGSTRWNCWLEEMNMALYALCHKSTLVRWGITSKFAAHSIFLFQFYLSLFSFFPSFSRYSFFPWKFHIKTIMRYTVCIRVVCGKCGDDFEMYALACEKHTPLLVCSGWKARCKVGHKVAFCFPCKFRNALW